MATPNIQPTHHLHSDNEPLPASTGQGTIDYSKENVNRLADQDQDEYPAQRNATNIPGRASIGTDDPNRDSRPFQGGESPTDTSRGEGRHDERPAGSDDTSANVPHAGVRDKIIGKAEKYAGKAVRDHELEAKGTIRSEIGKV